MFCQEKPYRKKALERTLPVKNSFAQQFSENIKFKYSCFDRVVLRGYIRWLFFPGGVVKSLRLMGFRKLSNGVLRILTDQLNAHILKVAQAKEIPIHWWPSVDGGKGLSSILFKNALFHSLIAYTLLRNKISAAGKMAKASAK
jgi:hypothetical protein